MTNQNQLAVKSVLDAWHFRVKAVNEILNKLTDEQLQHEISPGRNRGIYLLGHLSAVHDRMLPLLNFEQQMYPQLDEPFINQPDKAVAELPSANELRIAWSTINSKLTEHFNELQVDEWFQKHSNVSVEDFAKEPHRNRLSIIISRTGHLASHQGQLVLLK